MIFIKLVTLVPLISIGFVSCSNGSYPNLRRRRSASNNRVSLMSPSNNNSASYRKSFASPFHEGTSIRSQHVQTDRTILFTPSGPSACPPRPSSQNYDLVSLAFSSSTSNQVTEFIPNLMKGPLNQDQDDFELNLSEKEAEIEFIKEILSKKVQVTNDNANENIVTLTQDDDVKSFYARLSLIHGQGLINAARRGQTPIVQLILFSSIYISANHAVQALWSAAEGGHIYVVELLLNSLKDISANHAVQALWFAAEGGHIYVVELLLHSLKDISADLAAQALWFAAEGGHISVVELLLRNRKDISAEHAGQALRYAAREGHISVVELLLRSRKDISTDNVDWALKYAVQKDHTLIVQRLLQGRSAFSAISAYCGAWSYSRFIPPPIRPRYMPKKKKNHEHDSDYTQCPYYQKYLAKNNGKK